MTVLKQGKLEELLVANWTSFMDYSKLMAFVLKCVRDNVNKDFSILTQSSVKRKGVQITLSRFQLVENGFIVWVDFSVPHENNVAVGTSELHLSPSGTLTHMRTLGNLFASG